MGRELLPSGSPGFAGARLVQAGLYVRQTTADTGLRRFRGVGGGLGFAGAEISLLRVRFNSDYFVCRLCYTFCERRSPLWMASPFTVK